MMVIVVHDAEGHITSLGMAAPPEEGIGLRAPMNHHVARIEVSEVEHVGQLAQYAHAWYVDRSSGIARLAKR